MNLHKSKNNPSFSIRDRTVISSATPYIKVTLPIHNSTFKAFSDQKLIQYPYFFIFENRVSNQPLPSSSLDWTYQSELLFSAVLTRLRFFEHNWTTLQTNNQIQDWRKMKSSRTIWKYEYLPRYVKVLKTTYTGFEILCGINLENYLEV